MLGGRSLEFFKYSFKDDFIFRASICTAQQTHKYHSVSQTACMLGGTWLSQKNTRSAGDEEYNKDNYKDCPLTPRGLSLSHDSILGSRGREWVAVTSALSYQLLHDWARREKVSWPRSWKEFLATVSPVGLWW